MRYLTIILLFISSLAMAQRPYLFPTIADAASNTYIGIGAYVQTQGYSASGDGGGALYRMTAIGSAPMAADSGYVYPVTAGKVLVQVLEDEYLRTATYGVVCGSSAQATNNYNRLQRFFNAIDTLDKQAFVNGCNDTIYVNFTSALTTTLTSHDKFVMRGEGADVTRIKATAGSIDFGFSDAAKVNLFDLYLDGYDATAFGGIGGADQSLTYVNDTLTISGGNYVVITGGGGGGTDDQTLSIDSNASTFTLAIESGNSVQFSKSTNTDDQAISLDSTATSYTATVEDGGSITWAKVTDTDTDDQTLSFSSPNLSISEGNSVDLSALQDGTGTDDQTLTLDSVSGTYNLTIESGNTVKIKRDTDTDDQTLSIDSNATTYTLTIVDGNNVKFAKGGGGGGGTPAGSSGEVQYNNGGSFGGASGLVWDAADTELQLATTDAGAYKLQVTGNTYQVGRQDLRSGGSSTFTGEDAGLNDDGTANLNTFYGYYAGRANTSGFWNTAFGYRAGSSMTTSFGSTYMGRDAGYTATGGSNTGIGNEVLKSSTGGNNTALGYRSLDVNTTGASNNAIGANALGANVTGQNNNAMGATSLASITAANFNTAIGSQSLVSMTNVGATYNVAIGYNSADTYTDYTQATIIGSEAEASASGNTNETVIGYNAVGNGSNTVTLGNTSVTDLYTSGTIRSGGAYIGRVTTFNSTPSQTTFGAYICHVDYTTTGAFSLIIDTDNLVAGYTLIIKDVDGNAGANNITISTEGAETIDGASTYVISTNYGSVQLYSDGVNWYTF